jgi:hypothetical protein
MNREMPSLFLRKSNLLLPGNHYIQRRGVLVHDCAESIGRHTYEGAY